jgi:predicted nucleic acid-binding Zn ribbon protein
MPYYEYRCASNGQTLEVRHGMNETLATWGEVVSRAGAEVGDTPADAPVERLMSAPVPLKGTGGSETGLQGCGSGCACVPHN